MVHMNRLKFVDNYGRRVPEFYFMPLNQSEMKMKSDRINFEAMTFGLCFLLQYLYDIIITKTPDLTDQSQSHLALVCFV